MNFYLGRFILLVMLLIIALIGIFWRLVDLSVFKRFFLLQQSKARILRNIPLPAHRGVIFDRLGKPLAISVLVDSIWVDPKIFRASNDQVHELSVLLNETPKYIDSRVKQKHHEFVYLKRRLSSILAKKVVALKIQGVFTHQEYRRYYPDGEMSAHVLGLTNVDDEGQEGLELAYNHWLRGESGQVEVLRDLLGHVVKQVAVIKEPRRGLNLQLSLDRRLQYSTYQILKKTVNRYHASSGSIVVLNVSTGEVLAMVNQPSYDPNHRLSAYGDRLRNRAVVDVFEPGSTIKPFNIAFALESGKYTPGSTIDTNPGWMKVGGYTIRDDGLNYGVISLTQVLKKSSNIGAAKIMLSLQPQQYWYLLHRLGFGRPTQSGFPGEASGTLVKRVRWQPSVVATLAYGYGIAVTALQIAHAYAILANHGLDVPVTFFKISDPPLGQRVLGSDVADKVVEMLETVVQKGGTGWRAGIAGYRVAGKTGTAYVATAKGYDKHRYVASFIGLAPVSHPRFVVAVIIHDPKGSHLGGRVAAPVFAEVMSAVLHFFHVSPDALYQLQHVSAHV